MPKYITYRRCSHAEAKGGTVSLDWQKAEIDRWLHQQGATAEIDLVDDGVSGGIHVGDRDAAKTLHALRKAHDAVVLVAMVDRLFRSVEDMAVTLRVWRENNVRVISTSQPIDLSTPTGRFLMTTMVAVAELEADMLGDRVRRAVAVRKEQGSFISGEAPYGWAYQGERRDADGKTAKGSLVVNEAEQEVIAKIRKLKKTGLSLRAIAERLTKDGVPTRQGRPWIHTMVQKILLTLKERRARKTQNRHVNTDLHGDLDLMQQEKDNGVQ